jgi:hypothetical protein
MNQWNKNLLKNKNNTISKKHYTNANKKLLDQ